MPRLYQLGDRRDAVVGGLQGLDGSALRVQEIVEIRRAAVEPGRGEEVGRIVEGRIDTLAGGETGLRDRNQISGALQLKEVGADTSGKSDIRRHDLTFLVCTLCALDLPFASEQRAEYRHNTLTSGEERWLIRS